MSVHSSIKDSENLVTGHAVIDWYRGVLLSLSQTNQRVIVNLQGQRSWCLELVSGFNAIKPHTVLSNEVNFAGSTPFSKVETLLGLEAEAVVYDGFSGINIDVLCMAAGLIRATGVLIVISPSDHEQQGDVYGQWQGSKGGPPYFLRYLFRHLLQDMWVVKESSQTEPDKLKGLPFSPLTEIRDGLTQQQAGVLLQMGEWLNNSKRPLFFLTADRGRGKSTALGLFARQQAQTRGVVISAASRSQASILLQQLDSAQHSVRFMAPDEIIRSHFSIPLLIIDEAAMLPNSMLRQCIALADRTLLATTTGGYEGTGQGFLIKLKSAFDQGDYLHQTLKQPIRWGQQDLLERWLNRVLMFDTVCHDADVDLAELSIQSLSKKQLSVELDDLRAIYGLLTSAHYRTRPSDLRQMMEDESQQILVARSQRVIIGVLLLNEEGGFDTALCQQVFLGKRRPQGHLLAQMITAQAGVKGFACLKGYRVQRIAVDDRWRRKGVGRQLIEAAEQMAQQQQMDYLGSSFALDHAVAPFWGRMRFTPIHIGLGKGKSSGRQTVAVIRSLSPAVDKVVAMSTLKVKAYLPVWLLGYCNELYWLDVLALIRLLNIEYELTVQDEDELLAFATGFRGLELSQGVLQRLLISRHGRLGKLPEKSIRLGIEKILLNRDWSELDRYGAGVGRKVLLVRLREIVAELMGQSNSEQ